MKRIKKYLLTVFLSVVSIAALCFCSFAAQTRGVCDGTMCSAVLNYNASYNGAYASTAYGRGADRVYAYVKYTYRETNGTAVYSVSDSSSGARTQSVSANASHAGTRVSAVSSHSVTNNGYVWSASLDI